MKPSRLQVAVLCLLPLLGCERKTAAEKASEQAERTAGQPIPLASLRIASAAGPVAWLGCQVVGAPCEAVALVPPGASAHTWEPKPSDLKRLEGVDAWLRTGLAFETSWTPRLQGALPNMPMFDLRGALDLGNQDGHRHGRMAEEKDPHVWASPRAMKTLAETLAVRLVAQRPDLRERVVSAMPHLRTRLDDLDVYARSLLAPWSGRTFFVNHPGLGYLARDYGLVQKSLEQHGRELSPVDLFEMRRVARAQGIKAVFVQREASDRTARSVSEELGVPMLQVDLLATPWDSAFRGVVGILAEHL